MEKDINIKEEKNFLNETSELVIDEFQKIKNKYNQERKNEEVDENLKINYNTKKLYYILWKNIIKESEEILKYNATNVRLCFRYNKKGNAILSKFYVSDTKKILFPIQFDRNKLFFSLVDDEVKYMGAEFVGINSELATFEVTSECLENKINELYNKNKEKVLNK